MSASTESSSHSVESSRERIPRERGPDWRAWIGAWASRLAKSTFWLQVSGTLLGRVAGLGLSLLGAVITARALGPDGRGVFAVMVTIGTIGVQFGHLGVPAANTFFVASDRRQLPQLVGANLAGAFGVGAAIAGGFIVFVQIFPEFAPLNSLSLLAWGAVWIPFGIWLMNMQNLLLGLERIREYNWVQIFHRSLTVAAIAVLWALGYAGTLSFYLANLLVLLTSAALLTSIVFRSGSAKVALPSLRFLGEVGRYGFRAYLAALFSYLVLHFDLLMVAGMLGDAEAGLYSIAARMADMLYMIPVALGTILFSTVSRMRHGQWQFTRRVLVVFGAGILPLFGLAGIFAEPAIDLLFGSEFLPAVPVFLFLLPGIYMLSLNTILMNYFAGTGMPIIAVVSPAIAAAVNVAANAWALPRWGIPAAGLTSTLSYTVMLLSSLAYLRYSGLRSRRPAPDAA